MWQANKCMFGIGIFTLILGSGVLIFQGSIMSGLTQFILRLDSSGFIFDIWKNIPVEVPTSFYFFNWTNKEDFFKKDFKPKLDQIGPYRFLEKLQKIDTIENDNDTITYKQIRTFRYDEEFEENGNLSDKLTTINFIASFLGHRTRYWDILLKDVISYYLTIIDPTYYVDSTPGAELFTGNDNMLMDILNYVDFLVPELIRLDHFGWLKMRNGDPNFDGVFNVEKGGSRQFDVKKWNYDSHTPYFKGKCNEVRGSTGELHSKGETNDYMDIFISDICRYVRLYFDEEVVIYGILGHKYSATKRSLDNGTMDPENKCFCGDQCMPSGLVNVTSCRYGLNLFMSLPHFYNADESYLQAVEGLSPNKSEHESYMVIEPNTRVVLDFRLRAQVNIHISDIEGISYFDNFPELYFPVMYLEQRVQLPEFIIEFFKIYSNVPYGIIAIGIILTVVGSCLTARCIYQIIGPYSIKKTYRNSRAFSVILESVPLNQNKNPR